MSARPLRDLAAIGAWRWWVLGCTLARLPVTMSVVALVLAGRRLGSFSVGAGLAAVASLGAAGGAWWRARAMDRGELRRALARDLCFTAAGYAAVAALVHARAPVVTIGVAVAAASVASSALFAGYRSMLPAVVPHPLLPSAFAIDAVLVEVGFVLGPAIAGLLSLVVGASGVLVGMAVVALVATAATRRLPRRPPHVAEEGATPAAAPWRDGEVVANYAATVAAGAMIGLFEAGFAPFAEALGHRPGVGGVLSATYAFGSGVGGLVFATRLAHREGHAARGLVLLAVLGALIVPAAVAPSLAFLVPLLLVAGTPFATANAAAASHLQARVHPLRSTEGFALQTTAVLLGIALGNAAASVVLRGDGSPRLIYVVAGVPPVVAAVGVGLWARLRARPPVGVGG